MAVVSQEVAVDGFVYDLDSALLSTFGEIDFDEPPQTDTRHYPALRKIWPFKELIEDE